MDRGELPGVFGRDRVEVLPHQVVVAGAGDPADVDRPADREGAGEHVLERGDVGLDRHGGSVGQRDIVDVEGRGGRGGRLHFQREEVGVPRHREQGRHPHPLTGGDDGVGDDCVEAGDAGEPPLDGGAQAGVRLAGRQLRPDRHPIAEAAGHLAQDVQGGPLPDGRAAGRTQAARASMRLLGHIGEHRGAQRGPVPIAAVLRGEAEAAAVAVRLEVAGETALVGHHFRDAEVVDVVLRRGARALHVQDQLRDVGGEPVAALERHPASAGHSVGGAGRDGVEPVGGLPRHPALDRHPESVLEGRLSRGQANGHPDLVEEVLLDHGHDVETRPVPQRRAARGLEAVEAGGGGLVRDGQDRSAAPEPALSGAVLEIVVHDLGAYGNRNGERRHREQESGSCASAQKRERLPHGASRYRSWGRKSVSERSFRL